jgi:hypothetical protein
MSAGVPARESGRLLETESHTSLVACAPATAGAAAAAAKPRHSAAVILLRIPIFDPLVFLNFPSSGHLSG